MVQAVGKTTFEMLALREGDSILDFIGPLGLPSHIRKLEGTVVLVGGGLGVAPIYPQLRAYKEAGNRTVSIVGFRNRDLVFWEEQFRECSDELIVTTDDGSYGRHGFVTHALADVLASEKNVSEVVAIGPIPMMKACCEVTRPFGIPTVVSLNSIMVDGTGMCGSCRVTVGGEHEVRLRGRRRFRRPPGQFRRAATAPEALRPRREGRHGALPRANRPSWPAFPESNGAIPERLAPRLQAARSAFPKRPPCAFPRTSRRFRRSARPCRTSRPKRACTISTRSRSDWIWMAPSTRPSAACAARSRAAFRGARWASISRASSPRWRARTSKQSYHILKSSNALPAVCGRVCPQESQCEATCVVGAQVQAGGHRPPGAFRRRRRHGPRLGQDAGIAETRETKRAAIIGSGPAGLACAGELARRGVKVTVFEALHVAGGVLKYGIPEFRLPDIIIDAEIENLKKMGVEIRLDTIIGKLFTIPQLLGEMGYHSGLRRHRRGLAEVRQHSRRGLITASSPPTNSSPA